MRHVNKIKKNIFFRDILNVRKLIVNHEKVSMNMSTVYS